MRVALVSAVHERYELSEVWYPATQRILQRFRNHGIGAGCFLAGKGLTHFKLSHQHGFDWIRSENRPLGRKWNAALREAMWWTPDYIFILGQDDFFSDALIDAYADMIRSNVRYAGINKMYFYEPSTSRCLHYKIRGDRESGRNWQDNAKIPVVQRLSAKKNTTLGAGRLIHRSLLEGHAVWWEPTKERALDASMARTLSLPKAQIIPTDEDRFAVDIKTSANIWSFDALAELFPENIINDPSILAALPEWDQLKQLRELNPVDLG